MNLPPIELLEAHHDFPGPFVFKIIGRTENDFEMRAVAAVRDALGLIENPVHSARNTSEQRHTSVTIEVTVASAQAVHDVYEKLMKLDGILVLL